MMFCNHCGDELLSAREKELVYSHKSQLVMIVCEECQDKILDECGPGYVECCPNCGCYFGVN